MSHSQIKTRIISDMDHFESCRDKWNELSAERLFHSWEWMYSWWQTYHQTGDLAIVIVMDQDDRWIGIAPWFKTISASRGHVIRVLGSGAACSDYVSVVTRPGDEELVAEKLLSLMFADNRPVLFENVDLFELEGHRRDDPVIRWLVEKTTGDIGEVVQEEIAGTWRTNLPATWEEFNQDLRKSFRRKTKKALQRLQSGEFVAKTFQTPRELESVWASFVDLHQRRRQFLGQSGCFSDRRFESFLKTATLRLGASELAKINVIFHQDQALCCHLEFSAGKSRLMYLTGIDPDRMRLEPGHITFTRAIRDSIDQGCTSFDFLRGDEPYKRLWNAERISLYRTRFIPNRLKANIRHSIFTAGKQIRSWARTVKGHFHS